MHELTEGALLAGRYTLVRRIGSGGMSTTWLADDSRSESRVALKIATDPALTVSLQKEWRIGSRLMHANIVRVFEFHEEGDFGFYAMQHVNGPDISALTGGDLTGILRPAGLVADALRYAHAKDLVHRDIKASNILIDQRGIPYLMDFGIAAIAGEPSPGGGTPVAASPQQLAGASPTASDDIYSFGVLLCELISGNPPGPENSPAGMSDANGDPLPTAVSTMISSMLDADAAMRPSASEIAEKLDQAGFPAGMAPARQLGAGFDDTQTVSAEAIRPHRRAPVAPASEARTDGSGVSQRNLYRGLGILLAVFVLVVFILPWVFRDSSELDVEQGVEVSDGVSDESLSSDSAGTGATNDPRDADENAGSGSATAVTDVNGSQAGFSENLGSPRDIKEATDEALGDLLSALERLRYRGVDRWGGQPYLDALDVYAEGDRAYVADNYRLAGQHYRKALEIISPLYDRINEEFDKALASGKEAFDNGDHVNAILGYDLAVAITPGNREAEAGLARAKNLKSVLDLVDQALQFELDLELDAARIAFEQALQLDGAWQPAIDGIVRIRASIKQSTFDQRMTEGIDALLSGDFASARAAFNAAKAIDPTSRQPTDGLHQVDQEIRLSNIRRLEDQARSMEENEEWESAIGVYQEILKIDGDLQFAKEGLSNARERERLYQTLKSYIDDPDSLSAPPTMDAATRLLLNVSRVTPMGPRLEDQKNSLARLLKRAATPLDVFLVSDNSTSVAVNRVARLGTFQSHQLSLRPGVYVAVGSRPGYRDVRIEFRVAPEIEMKPIVVQCEEQI